eukprot:TRINITY_DN7681_c2_g1_i1.p1 TRINITY_DN7681_c2_g1~~TRINITY_DN7681_c2_g1_i1.p1  ORF type:complete len:161 (+),score=69.71 TRINITY_DN7681_c2_g1_i1:85-567(+)
MAVTLHTNFGDIKLEIFCDQVPLASENFLALCASGYYDNTIFHRNIKNFILQGGDPTGTGSSGESIWKRKFKDEFVDVLKHNSRGVVSMASSGPDKNNSQFFITYEAQSRFDKLYTIFAKVISGWETLNSIEKVPVDSIDRPLQEIKIINTTIHANPLAD